MDSPFADHLGSPFAAKVRMLPTSRHATRSTTHNQQTARKKQRLMASLAKRRKRTEMTTDRVVAKRGDVRLELSRDGKLAITLLVSSHILALASPVFEAMFNDNFAESQDLSPTSPKTVALPDDDADAMTLFCNIIHMRIADISETVSMSRLADLAVVCDKYRCTEAVSPWAPAEIAQKLSNPDAPAFEKLLFITYVFDLPFEFGKVSSLLIYDRVGTVSYQTATHGSNLMPLEIIDQIRYKRIGLLESSRQILFGQKYQNLLRSRCSRASMTLKDYLANLDECGIPMNSAIPVAQYAKSAVSLERLSLMSSCAPIHPDCAVQNAKGLCQEVAAALIAANEDVKACCLDCLRRNVCGLDTLVCRLGHAAPR